MKRENKFLLTKKWHGWLLTAAAVLMISNSFGQVGIGTVSPAGGSQLDVTGSDKAVLIPRLDIDDLGSIDPVTGGSTESLLAYNTNTTTGKGFYYWDGSKWVKIKDQSDTSSGDFVAVKYTSDSDSQDLSTNSFSRIEIFTDLAWNDDTSVFEVLNNKTIRITEAGRYRITANLSMLMDDDLGLEVRINVDGADVGASYIASRVDNDDTPRSLYISETLQIDANDLLRIRGRKTSDSGGSGNINLFTTSESYIEIVKLD